MDLFSLIFNSISPYLFTIAKMAFAITIFSCCVKLIRGRSGGGGMNSGGSFSGFTTAFIGYLLCRGIPVIIMITDRICNEIVKSMGG